MNDKKNILLTGATGFLGAHLLTRLVMKNYNVIVLKRTFSDLWRIKDLITEVGSYNLDKVDIGDVFKENSIDVIIHLATDYGKKNNNDVSALVEANVCFAARLLNLAVSNDVKFFINTHTHTGSNYTLYSATKNAFIEIAKFFFANHVIHFVNLKLEYMYGEKDDSTKFVPFVIENILRGKEIKASPGEQKRDFIYVADVVNAYIKVLENLENLKEKFLEFNIGTGESISFKDFIKRIEHIIGVRADIKWSALPYRNNEIFDVKADIRTAAGLLKWKPEISLENGLANTVNWYKSLKDESD